MIPIGHWYLLQIDLHLAVKYMFLSFSNFITSPKTIRLTHFFDFFRFLKVGQVFEFWSFEIILYSFINVSLNICINN